MENFEDDDDTHFCIKCHLTISGLENYVRHRQAGCCRPSEKHGDQGGPSGSATVSYPEVPNADAFFNSLELQSSAKKPTRRLTRTRVNSSRRDDTQRQSEARRKSRRSQVEADDASNSKAQMVAGKLDIIPVDAELDNPTEHLSIPSLVGFPDIVSSASKPASKTLTMKQEAPMDNSLDNFMADEAVQKSKRGEVWLGDTMLADHHLGTGTETEEIALSRYEDYDYVDDESEDECSPEEDVGDDESSETDDANDPEYPPQEHTGGKWRPGLASGHQVDSEADEDNPERPPPSHTGGKWKPSETNSHGQRAEDDEKEATGQPPPSHTRGKWVPGARSDQGNGFYCSPCGRRLASRVLYNRHLLTELHAKRSIRELDGVLRLPREAETLGLEEGRGTWRRKVATWKVKENEELGASEGSEKKSRKRKREVTQCEMCRIWVKRPHMGKHLLSHYHCRVAGVVPRSPRARDFLLDNMANVVRRCPFQCAGCRFYCNTEETFLLHWRSEFHRSRHREISGIFRCAACNYWCDDNSEMECHMLSSAHRQVVSMVNGSVPVVISRQRRLLCDTCGLDFRYNRQLMDHVSNTGHVAESASDAYQSRMSCPNCDQLFRSPIALQRHQLSSHLKNPAEPTPTLAQSEPYFCSICSMTFSSAGEALRHRKTPRHREMVEDRKSARRGIERRKECPHCNLALPDLEKLKEHLLQQHVELCHRCPRCGLTFALSQNLAMHTRKRECIQGSAKPAQESECSSTWKCSQCPFTTNSESESIYHETLHAGSSVDIDARLEPVDVATKKPNLGCPICDKSFKTQQYLLRHIRIHTGEKPFPCPTCKTPFAKRSKLNLHRVQCSGIGGTGRHRNYVCQECNDAFYTNHALQQHMIRHTGKKYLCGLPGCPTALRTEGELRTHRNRIHGDQGVKKTYQCQDCSYECLSTVQLRRHQKQRHRRTGENTSSGKRPQDPATGAGGFRCPYTECHFKSKLKSHLQRHLRLHTGSKPYRCPYCAYASNNFENLRKHILTTRIHPGKSIYECTHCDTFRTNFARELRAHLLQDHQDNFGSTERAANHVASMYSSDREPDPTSLSDQASLSCPILLLKEDNNI